MNHVPADVIESSECSPSCKGKNKLKDIENGLGRRKQAGWHFKQAGCRQNGLGDAENELGDVETGWVMLKQAGRHQKRGGSCRKRGG